VEGVVLFPPDQPLPRRGVDDSRASAMPIVPRSVDGFCRQTSQLNTRIQAQMPTTFDMLITNVEKVLEDKDELDKDAAVALLREYEESAKQLIDTDRKLRASSDCLSNLSGTLPEEIDAMGLRSHFTADMENRLQQQQRGEYSSYDFFKTLQKHINSVVNDGEGGRYEMEEDVTMTQEIITNFKCPLTQLEMAPTGEMRPMTHNNRCVFSYRGAKDFYTGSGSKSCPTSGCNAKLKFSDLKDFKDFARKIAAAREDAEDAGEQTSQYVG